MNLSIVAGDDRNYLIEVSDEDGNPIDITGYTFHFRMKEREDQDDEDAVINKSWTDHFEPTNGKTLLQLSSSESNIAARDYLFNIWYFNTGGKRTTLEFDSKMFTVKK